MWRHSTSHSKNFLSIYFSVIDTELILIYLFILFISLPHDKALHNELIKMTVPRAVHHSLINNLKIVVYLCCSLCFHYDMFLLSIYVVYTGEM